MHLLLTLALAGVLVACGADTPTTADPIVTPGPGRAADGVINVTLGQATGPGISIADAVNQAGQEPLLVNGSLFVDPDGTVLLCDAIAESFPPQCGGTRFEVRGLDVDSVPDLEEANGVRWAEGAQVLGTVALVEG